MTRVGSQRHRGKKKNQNYSVFAVDTPFTITELQLAKTDDGTFAYVAVPTQGTPCR